MDQPVQPSPSSACEVDGCATPPVKRRMCNKHYLRWKKSYQRAGLQLPEAPASTPRPIADLAGSTPHDERYRDKARHRIAASTRIDAASGCWIWQKAVDRDGYGVMQATRRDSAHRIAYIIHVGPIPGSAVIDHRCHTEDRSCPGGTTCQHRRCVNPDHLELVTPGENTRRGRSPSAMNAMKTHCHRGHKFSAENTIARPDGRACRACHNVAAAASKRRRKEAQR